MPLPSLSYILKASFSSSFRDSSSSSIRNLAERIQNSSNSSSPEPSSSTSSTISARDLAERIQNSSNSSPPEPSSSTSTTISARDFSETLSPIMRRMVETVSTVMNPEFSVSKESKALRRAPTSSAVKSSMMGYLHTVH